MLTSENAKQLKARVKKCVYNIATLTVVPVSTKEGTDALSVPLVIDNTEASVQDENV